MVISICRHSPMMAEVNMSVPARPVRPAAPIQQLRYLAARTAGHFKGRSLAPGSVMATQADILICRCSRRDPSWSISCASGRSNRRPGRMSRPRQEESA